VDPSGKRCYSSSESSVQGLASEQSRHFFHSRYAHEERWSAALTVKRPKCDLGRISGINWVPLTGNTTMCSGKPHLSRKRYHTGRSIQDHMVSNSLMKTSYAEGDLKILRPLTIQPSDTQRHRRYILGRKKPSL